jgi:hypothetical protein
MVQHGIKIAVECFKTIQGIGSEKKHNDNYDRKLDE